MLSVDRFTVDDSIVDDSIVEARDFVTDSKAFTNINPTLLMNISYHNKVKPDSGHWSYWWPVVMNHSDDGDEFVRPVLYGLYQAKSDPGPDLQECVVTTVNMLSF